MHRLMMIPLVLLVAACDVDEDDIRAAEAAQERAEMQRQIDKSQDFDAIAADAVKGVDTTGFDALE